jgi:hypothetical protein
VEGLRQRYASTRFVHMINGVARILFSRINRMFAVVIFSIAEKLSRARISGHRKLLDRKKHNDNTARW